MQTRIQTDLPASLQRAKYAASRGYVGVVSDTHGKRLSRDDVVLYEKDAQDTWGVIDWISKQPWSDGQVGMYGGSNTGFTQWAPAKTLHPALKTLVPSCPLDPDFGLPMLNNVFITGNYDVLFYLGNTKEVDENFSSRTRYLPMLEKWYRSGRPYREIDQVDGMANPWLQKYLQHPPETILSQHPDFKDAVLFVSEPLDTPVSVNGLFSASLRTILNKKDMDVIMVLYEVTPSGELFHMSWTLQRASFAQDNTHRQLLTPNRPQTIPLNNTLLVSRQLSKGSRFLVALTISRSSGSQINYGTGKDVSDESIADAKEPLIVRWLDASTVTIPIAR